jgi:hypothetical protein
MTASFTMKLARANEHLRAVDEAIVDFLKSCPYEVVTEQMRGQIRAHVVYRHRPPDRLLMVIGDAVHNLRSALGHLAWSLAGPSADKRTEFPILIDRTKFFTEGMDKMHDMPAPAQNIIETLQPYHQRHGLPKEKEHLWVLQNLDIEDKHHTLNLVAAGVMGNVHISSSRAHPAYGLTGVTGYMPLADGAEIFSVTAPVDQSQMQDFSRYTFDVAFDPAGAAAGASLGGTLSGIWKAVAEAIQLVEPHVL